MTNLIHSIPSDLDKATNQGVNLLYMKVCYGPGRQAALYVFKLLKQKLTKKQKVTNKGKAFGQMKLHLFREIYKYI